jgi:hypothetical protein
MSLPSYQTAPPRSKLPVAVYAFAAPWEARLYGWGPNAKRTRLVAWAGIEPASLGYEPSKGPLLYPAMSCTCIIDDSLQKKFGVSQNFSKLFSRRDRLPYHHRESGQEKVRFLFKIFPAWPDSHQKTTCSRSPGRFHSGRRVSTTRPLTRRTGAASSCR